jgi:hypothetical protein
MLLPPSAAALFESLRGIGYSLPSAVADLIDNSIFAEARNVWLQFTWVPGAPWVSIRDDGRGMPPEELSEAMRLGGKFPFAARKESDLGRFGLGLKTASLSQCRRLTVASRTSGTFAVRRWDLDHITRVSRDWELLEDAAPGSEQLLTAPEGVDRGTGTVVLWEEIDGYLDDQDSKKRQGEDAFLEATERVEAHLAMVFHRFLEGPDPALRIYLNGRDESHQIRPWDPFLTGHPALIPSPRQQIQTRSGRIVVQGVVLPHKDRLTEDQFKAGGGPEGWTAQQGFYVYRNRRLLVAGDWLGLGAGRGWTKEEAHKLARIRLDLPNSADAEWRIDIKKSAARPPATIRPRLRAIAEKVRAQARGVFAHRGNYGPNQAQPDLERVWKSKDGKGGVLYRVDRDHPSVQAVFEAAGANGNAVESLLRVIEETVPVQRIWLDTVEKGEVQQPSLPKAPEDEVLIVMLPVYRHLMMKAGLTSDRAKAKLLLIEPFNSYPELIRNLPETIS